MVLDLRAELQKAKDAAKKAAWVAKETTKAAVTASYKRGVEETEKRLAEEVAKVCRNYYPESWIEAFNSAGVPDDSELRKVERLFFLNTSEKLQLTSLQLPFYPLSIYMRIQNSL